MQILLTKTKSQFLIGNLSIELFATVYPLASLIAPLVGLAAMISCKTPLYQTHAYFNHVSMFVNTLLLFFVNIFIQPTQFLLIVSIILLITKGVLAYLLPH